MWYRLRWRLSNLRHKLWARPLLYAALAIATVFACIAADRSIAADRVPAVSRETVEQLLAIIAASMLSVATFAVASMVAAYASASSTATPRAFSLLVKDDVSRTALSGFIAAFIFSIVALTTVRTGVYGRVGLFLIFSITLLIFALVILVFLRWVDWIARLGRLGTTIDRVERAAATALEQRRRTPTLGGRPPGIAETWGTGVFSPTIGYVQSINVAALQQCATTVDTQILVDALPGTFVAPGRALAFLKAGVSREDAERVAHGIAGAFIVGDDRTFDEDPRFGLVALAEVAARALSPAVNDPGTAIDILGTFVRLFARWAEPLEDAPARHDRVAVPTLATVEMFDDAFTAIARDGAGMVEVAIRLQKAFISLAATGDKDLQAAAVLHARRAQARASMALKLAEERDRIDALAAAVERLASPVDRHADALA
jgi:uncharacterized membrane protein